MPSSLALLTLLTWLRWVRVQLAHILATNSVISVRIIKSYDQSRKSRHPFSFAFEPIFLSVPMRVLSICVSYFTCSNFFVQLLTFYSASCLCGVGPSGLVFLYHLPSWEQGVDDALEITLIIDWTQECRYQLLYAHAPYSFAIFLGNY